MKNKNIFNNLQRIKQNTMATYTEANQVRNQLKMKLSNYAWYNWSTVVTVTDGYAVLVNLSKIDNSVRKIISPVIDGIDIKMELG